jgi:hypothetical protein
MEIEDGRLRMEDGRVKGVASCGWKHRTSNAQHPMNVKDFAFFAFSAVKNPAGALPFAQAFNLCG